VIEGGFNRRAMAMDVADGSIAYVELYVGDAVAALEYFTGAFAFNACAVAERPDRLSVLLASRSAHLVVTEPRGRCGGSAVADWLRVHGDGVRDIALYRSDLGGVVRRAAGAGLPVLVGPSVDAATGTGYARVGGFGSVRHTLLDIWSAMDLPAGFDWQPLLSFGEPVAPSAALERIDHVVVCLPAGALESTVAVYQTAFGMRIIRSECVEVGDAAMNSHVLRDAAGVTYVMAEPDPAHAPGPVDRFLATHSGAGVQTLAFLTEDIVAAIRGYGARGVGFMAARHTADRRGPAVRVADGPEWVDRLADLKEARVLCDRDQDGARYQSFTTCPHDRDTLFYELVERRGSKAFGTSNIVALFQAREADLIARADPVGAGR
jgi:4-hydroxymandelate synthase